MKQRPLILFINSLIFLVMALPFTKSQAIELIACGHPYYPPVSWVQQQKLVGVAPAVVTQLFSELGYQVKFDEGGNWKRCLSEVQAGHADIVVAAYKIASRESYLDYSQQYIVDDPIGVLVNQNQSKKYQSVNDLKGKTVGLLFGDSFGDNLDKFIRDNNEIEYVSEGKQNLKKLAFDRIGFIPIGLATGKLQAQKFGYNKQVIAAPFKLDTEYYYLALSHKSKLRKHLPYLNHRLKQLHKNGKIRQLIIQYSNMYLEPAAKVKLP